VAERVGPVRACSVVCLSASGVIEVPAVRLREPAADAGFGHDQLSDRAGLMVGSEFPGACGGAGWLPAVWCVCWCGKKATRGGRLYHKVFAVTGVVMLAGGRLSAGPVAEEGRASMQVLGW
jgi:hypothetical protein